MSGSDVEKTPADMLSAFQAKRTRVTPGLASILKGTRAQGSTPMELTGPSPPSELLPTAETRVILPVRSPEYRPKRKARAVEPLDLGDLKKNAGARELRPVPGAKREKSPQSEALSSVSPVALTDRVATTEEPLFQRPVEISKPKPRSPEPAGAVGAKHNLASPENPSEGPAPLTGSAMMRLGLFLADVVLVLLGCFLIWGAQKPAGAIAITISLVLVVGGAWLGLWALLLEPEEEV
jgi:hypothetical protein